MNELIQYLKGYQAWRRDQDERTMSDAGINPLELGQMLDATIETLEAVSSNGPILVQERKIGEFLMTIRELKQENAELKSKVTLQQAANAACQHLPEGWQISLYLEKDAGYFELTNPDGDNIDPVAFQGESLTEELNEMLNIANGFTEGKSKSEVSV